MKKTLLIFIVLLTSSFCLCGCGKSAQEKHREALRDAEENYERESEELEKRQREYDDLKNKLDNIKREQDRLSNSY